MPVILSSWKPSLRNCEYAERPDFVPDEVYLEALAAKRTYNSGWEFWVWQVAQDYNVSQAEAEDACIRGLRRAIERVKLVYGDQIGKWWEEFMDMKDIYSKVKHPIYLKELGYAHGTPPIRGE